MKIPSLNDIKSILIIQFGPFGDVLLNTSYLDALKQRFPNARIDFLVAKPYDSVLHNHPALSELITFPKSHGLAYLWHRLRTFIRVWARHYDLVIDQQCGTGSGQVVMFSGAKYRLGFHNSKLAMFYNLVAPRGEMRYAASQKFDILQPLGIREVPYKLYYYIQPQSLVYIENWLREQHLESKKYICISPGSPSAKKVWDLSRYAELADRLITATSLPVIILWAKSEFDDAKTMLKRMQQPAIFAVPTTLNQAAALLKHSRLLICNDGGLTHLSVTTETPTLSIYGPCPNYCWSPEALFPTHASLFHEEAYDPADKGFGISVDEAFAAAMHLLDKTATYAPLLLRPCLHCPVIGLLLSCL